MNTFAFDHAGEHIPGKGKWANQFCPVVRGHAQRAGRICIATYETLAQAASAKRQIVVDRCGAGMLVFGVPVYVGDEYAGLVGGCGLLPPESEVDADAVSRATGMDKALVEQLAASVGEISRYDAETWIRFMEDRVRELVNRYKRGSSTMTSIKTFKDLVAEVQRRGLCHQCGGCVTFCSAMNYGALELSETGRPRFRDPDKCIQCGICYMICPEVDMLDNEVRRRLQWTEPAGRVLETVVARARDEDIRRRATDGGAVTAILTHLINEERIDGAAVTRQAGPFKRQPFLATSAAEIVESAGSHFDRSQMSSLAHYTQDYSTYSPSVRTLGPVVQKGLSRVAMVGTPCQINTVRKMQALGVAPSDSIHCTLGLFCSGNYVFGDRRREKIERMGDFKWSEVDKINIKDECIIRLKNGETRSLPLEDLDFVKRRACHFCADYGAEYADISFGGIGAEEGWTTVVTRTELGQSILDQALQTVLDLHPDMEDMRDGLQETVERHALAKKRDAAEFKRANLTDAAA
jgi:coenzyme F420 hydrogenase subunit beta